MNIWEIKISQNPKFATWISHKIWQVEVFSHNKKSVIFKCYSSENLIAYNTLHEISHTWYSFHSLVDWSNADKVSCSRTQHTDAGVWTVNLCIQKPTSSHMTNML